MRSVAPTDELWSIPFARPWGEAIVRPVPPGARASAPKRLDNRSRRPGVLLGRYIAIRATLTLDTWGLEWIRERMLYPWAPEDLNEGGQILGVARLEGCVEHSDDPWFFGPRWCGKLNYGWLLADVVPIDPLPYKPRCARGAERLGPDMRGEVVRRMRDAGWSGGAR